MDDHANYRLGQNKRRYNEANEPLRVTFSDNNLIYNINHVHELHFDANEYENFEFLDDSDGDSDSDNDNDNVEENNEEENKAYENFDDVLVNEETEDDTAPASVKDNRLLVQLKRIVMIEKGRQLAFDRSVELYPGSIITKDDAAMMIEEYINTTDGLTTKDGVGLLSLIHKMLPANSQLPIHFSQNGKLVSDLDNYTRSYPPFLSYQCCPCGGIVYDGENKLLDRCPAQHREKVPEEHKRKMVTCNTYRWTRCKFCGKKESCKHSANRIPLFQFQYRPILFILIELLKQGDGFLSLLDYMNLDDKEKYYSDVMDSIVVRKHLSEMKLKYSNKYKGQYNDPTMVNIVIGLNYDGAQIYKFKTSYFYPLLISILNLPPSYRKDLGIGMFMLSLFTLPQGSVCEDFLLKECLVKELEWLGEGVELTVLGEHYYVQVRLVLQVYDTPQLASIIKRKSMLSKGVPCPICNSVKGCLTHEFKHSVFAGDRFKLPWNHALRTVGMMQRCCPVDYYEGTTYENKTTLDGPVKANDLGHTALTILTYKTTSQITKLRIEDFNPCDKANANGILNILKNHESYGWFHERYDFSKFRKVLYAAYCDFRPECLNRRITQAEYCGYTNNATPDNPIHGFYETWAFSPLKYIDYGEMVNWDPFHSMKNFVTNVLELLIGNRGTEDKAISHYERIKAHPLLYTGSNKGKTKEQIIAPWRISNEIQGHVDSILMSIIYPSNVSKKFPKKPLFARKSELNGSNLIEIGSVLMDLIVYAMKDGIKRFHNHSSEVLKRIDPYLCFLSLVGDDFCFLRRPQFDKKNDTELIYNRLVELVSLHHLLFGTYQALIICHQLTDLPDFIKFFGPLRGWTTLGMERAIGRIKKKLVKGGFHIHLSVMKKQIGKEHAVSKNFYKNLWKSLLDENSTSKYKPLLDQKRICINELDNNNIQISSSDRRFRLKSPNSHRTYLSDFETNNLLLLLVNEVLKAVGFQIEDALQNSILYRLYYSFDWQMNNVREIKNQISKGDFYQWLLCFFRLRDRPAYLQNIHSYDNVDVENVMINGVVYNDDLSFLKASLFGLNEQLSILVFSNAIIFGTTFQSRGIHCREQEEAIHYRGTYGQQNVQRLPRKNCNNNNNLFENNGNSSWFSFKSNSSLGKPNQQDQIGQFNGFFRIRFELEPLLHGLPIGSMTGRKHDLLEHSLIRVHCNEDNYLSSYFFVPLTEVYSTQLGIVAFDESNNVINFSEKKTQKNINTLLFIELQSYRKCIIYEKENSKEYNNMQLDDYCNEN